MVGSLAARLKVSQCGDARNFASNADRPGSGSPRTIMFGAQCGRAAASRASRRNASLSGITSNRGARDDVPAYARPRSRGLPSERVEPSATSLPPGRHTYSYERNDLVIAIIVGAGLVIVVGGGADVAKPV